MFGHQDDTANTAAAPATGAYPPSDNSPAADPSVGAPAATDPLADLAAETMPTLTTSHTSSGYVADAPASSADPNADPGNTPADGGYTLSGSSSSDPLSSSTTPATGNDDLISIKQSALQQLTPLVGQLEQSPEEKFRTTMMMIQASDDQGLIKEAYAAAQAITDEKAKAQALLDVVNEINYFTQHNA